MVQWLEYVVANDVIRVRFPVGAVQCNLYIYIYVRIPVYILKYNDKKIRVGYDRI